MFKGITFFSISVFFTTLANAQLMPISFDKVDLQDDFWKPRMEIQKKVLVPVAFERTSVGLENLRRAGKILKGEKTELPNTSRFDTSDLYKVIEGAAYLLKLERDAKLEAKIDEIADIIKSAMESDGYIYPPITAKTINFKRYQDVLHNHELYNMGHLYEASVAYYLATGKTNLLEIAKTNAKHVNNAFFIGGDPKYNDSKPVNQAPGHQEIELALVKMYKITGDKLYLDMAKKFLDIRHYTFVKKDKIVRSEAVKLEHMEGSYAQQHQPVREQRKAVGHAVRATYMYSAMADVGSISGDTSYTPALKAIWKDIVNTKMHITGGLGAVAGIEGFGDEYVLPNETAYDETCAAIGNILFNYRMFLLERDAKYIDVAEVALFNNTLCGVSLSGDKFFYANPLESYGNVDRSYWFGCACCPTNIARVIPQVSGMMYAHEKNNIYCALYGSSSVEIQLKSGKVNLTQVSDYPFDENVKLTIFPQHNKQLFTLKLRIPTWTTHQFVTGQLYSYIGEIPEISKKWSVSVNGKIQKLIVENGFVSIKRKWKKGDVVKLHLPMPVRFNKSVERVVENRGRIAITRGPLVYCAESVDNLAPANAWSVSEQNQYPIIEKQKSGVLKGVDVIKNIDAKYIDKYGKIYAGKLTLIPYYAWNNRGDSSMNIWFVDNEKYLPTLPINRIYGRINFIKNASATHTYSGDKIKHTYNGNVPKSSADNSIGRWTSFPQIGAPQTLTYTLKHSTKLSEIAVYWYQDTKAVRIPQSWDIEYCNESGKWQKFPIYLTDSYSTLKNQFNAVHPTNGSITATAIKINVKPQPKYAVGILQIKLTEAK